MRRGTGGTETAKPLDPARVAKAFQRPGIDPRHWVSYGTVCTVSSKGRANFNDGSAVFVSPGGCTVDVLLMPANQHVPCRYTGVQGGRAGTIYTPIKPGDEVLVVIPDGDLRLPPVIACILSGEHSPLPLDHDRTPIFKNDRVLMHGQTVPVEIRTAGNSKVAVNLDGTVVINDGTKGAARLDDTTKLTLSADDVNNLAAILLATGLFVPSGTPPLPPPPPFEFTHGQITGASETCKIG